MISVGDFGKLEEKLELKSIGYLIFMKNDSYLVVIRL